MSGLWYEEFEIGRVFRHRPARTVTETDNLLFTSLTHNQQPLHFDAEFASESQFGQILVNSIFTLGLVVGLSVKDTTLGTTIANLGFREISFPNPVFLGDTLRAQSEVLAMRESRSKPDRGIVTFEHRGLNQDNAVVCRAVRLALMKKRPSDAEE